MAYVDHTFSIPDKDIKNMESSSASSWPATEPKVYTLAPLNLLLLQGTLSRVFFGGAFDMVFDATWVSFAILGSILFIPGFYYTRVAYHACKGYTGFSFVNIPDG